MCNSYLIKGGRLLDPVSNTDHTGDLFIKDGIINPLPQSIPAATVEIDAAGLCIAPGFTDLHVHFRDPGNLAAESIASGCAAAAQGGFTRVVMMPNTKPPIDSAAMIEQINNKAEASGLVEVLPTGCITAGRTGRKVADIKGMAQAGAVAFTDDGSTVADASLLENAMRQIHAANSVLMDHALDASLAADGVLHAGPAARAAGLPVISSEAEALIVKRDIELCARTGCPLHLQHISTAEAVELLAEAQQNNLPVSGEVTPHHLLLCLEEIDPHDPNCKMNPPLRSRTDRQALRDALKHGIIKTIATDHAPHTAASKATGMLKAPFGIIGLETAIGISYSIMVLQCGMPLLKWVAAFTSEPLNILGIPAPSLQTGQRANLTAMNLNEQWQVNPGEMTSRAKNMPYAGLSLTGRPVWIFRRNRLTTRNKCVM